MRADDAALFERWRTKRDGDAFAELARRHAPVVYDLAARTLGDRTAAEDVVQEALLDLALEETTKPAEVGIVAWLARFAICRAKNQRSSERARTRRQVVVGARQPEESMPDDELERREELERALGNAEPEERAALAMRYLHGWDYAKIARSLDTSEGAARVRVHRALANVRNRVALVEKGVTTERVTNRLAGLPLLPLSAGSLDSAIRTALHAAGVPTSGSAVPKNRLPAALRAGTQAFGVALLVAAAATTVARLGSVDPDASREDAAVARIAETAPFASNGTSAGRSSSSSGTFVVVAPRPENWDGGALARLARGDVDPDDPSSHSTSGVPCADKEVAAPAQAAPVAQGPLQEAAPSPPIAFRPNSRGACAANCDSGSSDGERADAFGGLSRAIGTEPTPVVVERAPQVETRESSDEETAVSDEPANRRASFESRQFRGRSLASLPTEERQLVEDAAALVRGVVVESGISPEDAATLTHVRRTGVREFRRQYRDWRRKEATADRPPALTAKKAVRMNRVLSILVDLALADGRLAGDLRWPDGIDVASAIEEVMRVLAAAPRTSDTRRPDIADDGTTVDSTTVDSMGDSTLPERDPERTPELR